jgi:hypothetical protein
MSEAFAFVATSVLLSLRGVLARQHDVAIQTTALPRVGEIDGLPRRASKQALLAMTEGKRERVEVRTPAFIRPLAGARSYNSNKMRMLGFIRPTHWRS